MTQEAIVHRDGIGEKRTIVYNDKIASYFIMASVLFALVAMLAGVTIALQLAFWQANLPPWFNFGRLRPLHTNAAIFAFVGNMVFAGVYYSTQRLLKTRLASDKLSWAHFILWQLIIVAAAVTLPLGITTSKEYAELEWPIDVAITITWVIFAINFFWTLAKRNEKHLYVAIWFYIATIVTVAVLHIVNSLALPVFAFKSYSVYGGAKDAMVQWWYGHNAVAFFLTTPILGIMYYFVPKASGRPVFSYRLSIVHFWALVFIYIWAGPHHLLNTALPDWTQSLGMIFSLMLWAPSWGGMINGLLTLRGAWDQLRTDPVLKFFAAGVTFYGMSTFEGPLLAIKSVSALAHYTDWIIGHVHSGALGWNGLMAAGMFYWMVPRLYNTKLYSVKLADYHFWIGTFGILLYMISMWVSGITQGMMWKALNSDGSLMYPNFVETLLAIRWLYWTRFVGGLMFFSGFIMLAYNLIMTARSGKLVEGTATVVIEKPSEEEGGSAIGILFGKPVLLVLVLMALLGSLAVLNEAASLFMVCVATFVAILGTIALQITKSPNKPTWHRVLEGRALIFTVLTVLAALVGGIVQIVPILVIRPVPSGQANAQQPYRPLELEGRDLYIREGCYLCHSQMIRPFRYEVMRYGDVSTLQDSQFDHPFQWGSKRTGPDLAREGGKYPNLWHVRHMADPRAISAGSNMPPYPHLATGKIDFSRTSAKVNAMVTLGVPYASDVPPRAGELARAQAKDIVKDLKDNGIDAAEDSEIVALVAYLQRLGRAPETPKAASAPVSLGEGK
jgi:cytochrome c oxidase cbb3-type subunit I/II